MPRNRLQITAFVTSIIQISLCALAIWSMWDTAQTSDQFSTGALDTHFQYTQQATLLPNVLLTVFACGLLCAVFWNRRPLAPWIYAALQIFAILIIACVWITLSRVDFAYATFFVASGALAPNEIMGSSWPLYIVVLLLTAAPLLGLFPLIWFLARLAPCPRLGVGMFEHPSQLNRRLGYNESSATWGSNQSLAPIHRRRNMNTRWFSRLGWFHVPVSAPGVILCLLAAIFCVTVFIAADRHSHSASDTLYGIFPFFACTFLLLDWIASRTSGARS